MIDGGRRALVTGAQGFLGRYLVHTLAATGEWSDIVGVGRSPLDDDHYTHTMQWRGRTIRAPLPPVLRRPPTSYRYESVAADDVRALAAIIRDARPHTIVHSAAALRDDEWELLLRANVNLVITLFDAMELAGHRASRVICVSSGSVYGPGDRLPHREGDACEPPDPYAISKLAGEHLAAVRAAAVSVELCRARVFNLAGPGLQERHLAASLARQIAEGGDDLTLSMGPLTTTRDYVDVRDAAAALVTLASCDRVPRIVNVSSGIEQPIGEVLRLLLEGAGNPPYTLERLPARVSDTMRSFADNTRLRALGWRAEFDLASSMTDMLGYCRALDDHPVRPL